MGALDFAGGAVVHVNAASAALVAAMVVGPRKDYGRHAILPHNVPFTMLGAGLLWFGWFGFNAGSALSAGTTATLAFTNTLLAPAATLATWTLLDMLRGGTVTAVGAATAIVVGLVVDHAGGRIHRSDRRRSRMGAHRRDPELLRVDLSRQDQARRFARRRRRARTRRRDRRDSDRRVCRCGVERRRRTA